MTDPSPYPSVTTLPAVSRWRRAVALSLGVGPAAAFYGGYLILAASGTHEVAFASGASQLIVQAGFVLCTFLSLGLMLLRTPRISPRIRFHLSSRLLASWGLVNILLHYPLAARYHWYVALTCAHTFWSLSFFCLGTFAILGFRRLVAVTRSERTVHTTPSEENGAA